MKTVVLTDYERGFIVARLELCIKNADYKLGIVDLLNGFEREDEINRIRTCEDILKKLGGLGANATLENNGTRRLENNKP